MLLQEEQVVQLFLLNLLKHRQRRRRRLYLRHGGVEPRLCLLHGEPACTGSAGAGAELSEPISIVVSSSSLEISDELAGKPASILLA